MDNTNILELGAIISDGLESPKRDHTSLTKDSIIVSIGYTNIKQGEARIPFSFMSWIKFCN